MDTSEDRSALESGAATAVNLSPGHFQARPSAKMPSVPTGEALIELRDVRKSYGTVQALAGVTATVSGQVIGLLGPNGAGKSTLLKCMLGLTPHQGEALVVGLSARTDSFRIRDRVGYMPELDSYLADLSAVELCTFAGELSGLPRSEAMQRAHAALYYAGLEDKRYLKVEGYSTGMKQRVKLAQALVHDPELLFLDEPTNGLDPRARDEMLELVMDLPHRRGCAIILSTHLLPDVDRICDQVIIMHRGHIRFSGSIEELRRGGPVGDAAAHVYDVEIKEGEDAFAAQLTRAGCAVESRPPRRLLVRLPADADSGLLFREARAAGAQIRHLSPNQASLEEAFMRVIGEAEPPAQLPPSGSAGALPAGPPQGRA
jgi:ABC-2 type transport system ATP-binding protein